MIPHIQAKIENNVHVLVCKPEEGRLKIQSEKHFKNTATRLMTESICEYLAGDENSYNRGHGRPNFMGFGTMGLHKQPNLETIDSTNADEYLPESPDPDPNLSPIENCIAYFQDKNPLPQNRTRPWFESTSLALTDTQGNAVTSEDGTNPHFWNPEYGWGIEENPDEPLFTGELCTAMPAGKEQEWEDKGWDVIQRIPILRADVISDCPMNLDYGVDGYSSAVIFYGYASVQWVNRLLSPSQKRQDPTGLDSETEPVGPQLDSIAISEFGLYEKNNTDAHGLHTLFAGFRVPTVDDIVYVHRNEVILVEWRVTLRALMPYEGVGVATEPAPTGISTIANVIDDHHVQMFGFVRGEPGVRQNVLWSISGNDSSETSIDSNGLLTLGNQETAEYLYVLAESVVDPQINAKSVIITGLIQDLITGISISTESVSDSSIQFQAAVLGKGTYIHSVTWTLTGESLAPGTSINPNTGLLTIDPEESATEMKITATSNGDLAIKSIAVLLRGEDSSSTYTISDFSILTE